MKIVVGCDGGSCAYKQQILDHLGNRKDIEAIDGGVYSDEPSFYADKAEEVGLMIRSGKADRGILICGGGNGMLIAANKIPGIRATMAFDSKALEKSVTSSACQVIVFGSAITDIVRACELIDEWVTYSYPDELSPYVKKVIELEKKYSR